MSRKVSLQDFFGDNNSTSNTLTKAIKLQLLSAFLSIGHVQILRETKYLKRMQNNIEKNKKTVINWSRYKRSSPHHVIESIKVISLKKSIVLSLPSWKVDYKNRIKKKKVQKI